MKIENHCWKITTHHLKNFYSDRDIFLFEVRARIAFQERHLTYDVDYDGFVVELKSMKGLLLPADYLQLMPNEVGSVRPVKCLKNT